MGKREEAKTIRKAQIEFVMNIIREGDITRSELAKRMPAGWPVDLIMDQINRNRLAYSKNVPLGRPSGGSQRLYSITPFAQPRDQSAFTGRLGLMMGYATIQPLIRKKSKEELDEFEAGMQRVHDGHAKEPPRKVPMPGIQASPVYSWG